ncbi:MAG: CDP-diacylglycerol--serine O-phosphatidyltransferase [Bacteroidales bacterium]|nr:CDP-diacylglycerol--serine O-phosphatidyltransferase [Bacteroidales bacterium]MBQ3917085.1 CDP-diacylglycerol--serine O-phosphatidyltransferase [Bacteroidales bacterium]
MSIKKFIPNTITSMNLLSGIFGVIVTFSGRLDLAFLLMLAASVFDFCDGLAARALHSYSDIGKELDSLSDLVSFGVLPALMLYKLMAFQQSGWVIYLPLVLAVFSALRLAKFNVDERQHHSFIGLPTPASAIICGSLCCYIYCEQFTVMAEWAAGPFFIPAVAVILSALMISEIPMFSMKANKDEKNPVLSFKRIAFFSIVAIIAIVVLVAKLHWSMIPLMSFATYVLMNVLFMLSPATASK